MRTEECRCWTGLLAVQTLQLKNIWRIMKQKKNLFQTRMREYCCSSSAAALLGSQIFTDYRGKTRGRFCAPHSNEQIWGFFLKVVHFLILNIRWVSIVNKNRFMISANHYILSLLTWKLPTMTRPMALVQPDTRALVLTQHLWLCSITWA